MIGIQGEKSQINGIDQIFHRITKDFPKLRKDTPMQIQEAHKTPNKQDQNRNYSEHMIVKKTKYIKQREGTESHKRKITSYMQRKTSENNN